MQKSVSVGGEGKHRGILSALAADGSGSRFVSGGYDASVHFWDLYSMATTTSLEPFRVIGGLEHPIKDLQFSKHGDRLLVISGGQQPQLYDRNGRLICTFPKGDMYLVDMRQTMGHVQAMQSGAWHPSDLDTFATCSSDGTVRIWNSNIAQKQRDVIVVRGSSGTRRIPLSSVLFSIDGKRIWSGGEDGVIRSWNDKAPFTRPILELRSNASEITSIAQYSDNLIAARHSNPHSLFLWDTRKPKDPVYCLSEGLFATDYSEANCIFSPAGDSVLTVNSVSHKKPQTSSIVSYDVQSGAVNSTFSSDTKSGMVRLIWPSSLDQIIVGLSDGLLQIYYDEPKGFALFTERSRSQKPVSNDLTVIDESIRPKIYTPHAILKDSVKRQRLDTEEPHIKGHGRGGQIGTNITQQILREAGKDMKREDPRDALLKYAEIAEKNPIFIAPAYSKQTKTADKQSGSQARES